MSNDASGPEVVPAVPSPEDGVQIVDFHGEFNAATGAFLERSSIKNVGTEYSVVGVLGAQSSGKSTLLNLLFHTPFQVLDSASGRQQTTQGIWLAVADAPIVVLDVEGTDSASRGEDHMAFERKSALLAMALCDVVIVNMWEHDVGRHDAANYTLLRTVFEVNLQLRTDATRTLLLFTLRDHMSTPIEKLSASLRKDIQMIWDSADKVPIGPGPRWGRSGGEMVVGPEGTKTYR